MRDQRSKNVLERRRDRHLGSRLAVAWLAATCCAGACSKDAPPVRVLDVYAASSLTEAFEELETAFEAEHRGTDVAVTFAGSQVLKLQIEQGANADVFASANTTHMRDLIDEDIVVESRIFAHNELVVIVPLSNPAGIESFSDLRRAERIVLGTKDVPVGSYARQSLERAAEPLGEDFVGEVMSHVVSEEANVRLVRVKVELGEADAAIVYATDAAPSDRVRIVEIPEGLNVSADYPIGIVERSDDRALAEQWIEFIMSEHGRRILRRHGFIVE
jgi:molybdate transport system substrate-binding protein